MSSFSFGLKTKHTAGIVSICSLTSGFFLLNQRITGNAIISDGYSFNILQGIGLLLIFCSMVLGAYALNKR